jgi:hypothetical protein
MRVPAQITGTAAGAATQGPRSTGSSDKGFRLKQLPAAHFRKDRHKLRQIGPKRTDATLEIQERLSNWAIGPSARHLSRLGQLALKLIPLTDGNVTMSQKFVALANGDVALLQIGVPLGREPIPLGAEPSPLDTEPSITRGPPENTVNSHRDLTRTAPTLLPYRVRRFKRHWICTPTVVCI